MGENCVGSATIMRDLMPEFTYAVSGLLGEGYEYEEALQIAWEHAHEQKRAYVGVCQHMPATTRGPNE